VDQEDKILEYLPWDKYQIQSQLVHRSVHVLVLNQAGQLILPLVSQSVGDKTKERLASIGGPVPKGQSHYQTARHYMQTCLGLNKLSIYPLLAKQSLSLPEFPELATIYLVQTPGPFKYDESNILSLKKISPRQLDWLLFWRKKQFSPNLRMLLKLCSHHLKTGTNP